MKISVLLPYKENYSPTYSGAVSIFIHGVTKYSNYKGSLNQIRHVDTTNMDMGKPPWKDSDVSKNYNGLYKYFNEGGQSTPGDTYTNEDWENQKGF